MDAELTDIDRPGYLRRTGRVSEVEEPVGRVLEVGVSNRTVLVERPDAWITRQGP